MKHTLLLVLLSIGFNASAQFTQDWIRTSGAQSRTGTSIARDANNNAFVASHDGSIWLRKYDIDGNLLWEVNDTTAVQFNFQYPSRVHVDPAGNALVVGYRYTQSSDGHNANAIVVLKYEADGNFAYKKTITGTFSYFNNSAYWTKVSSEMDATGHLFIGTAGQVDGYPNDGFNAIKINPSGNIAWVSTHVYATFFYYVHNIRLKGNKLGLAGATNYANANAAIWVLDTTGADKFDDVLIGVGGKDIAFDNNDNTYLLTWISTSFVGDVALYKFDSAGDTLWLETYDFGHSELSSRLEFMPDNNLAIMAYGNQQPANWYSDWITMKVDLDGNLIWSNRYDTHENNDELPQMLMVDQSSNVFVTGIGGPFPGGSNLGRRQMVVMKYSANGDSIWTAAFDTFTEYNTGVGLSMDSQNGLYVLGADWSMLVHYNDTTNTGVSVNENRLGGSVSIFPNPSGNTVNILSSTSELKALEVYDVTGREVFQRQTLASKQLSIDVDSWHNGIYFFKLTNENGQTAWWKLLKE